MQPKTLKILEDIREAATFIRSVTASESAGGYAQNRLLRFAVERNFEIIGEAIRRLEHLTPGTAQRITNHRRIVAFRNTLIHGYDLVDDSLVWDTIQHHLPVLLEEVVTLMAQETGENSDPVP